MPGSCSPRRAARSSPRDAGSTGASRGSSRDSRVAACRFKKRCRPCDRHEGTGTWGEVRVLQSVAHHMTTACDICPSCMLPAYEVREKLCHVILYVDILSGVCCDRLPLTCATAFDTEGNPLLPRRQAASQYETEAKSEANGALASWRFDSVLAARRHIAVQARTLLHCASARSARRASKNRAMMFWHSAC